MLLMLACLSVAIKSQLGSKPENADVLFLASQKHYADYFQAYEAYESAVDAPPESLTTPEEVKRLTADLRTAERSLTDPLTDVKKGHLWRLFTPMFLHFGILHLGFNLMWLWTLGTMLELRFGGWKFLGLLLAVALLSNVAQGYWSGTRFGGMSGANYGLFGFLYLRGKFHPAPGAVLSDQTIRGMLIWLVICFTGIVGPIANAAHLGGLIAGGLIGLGNALADGGWQIFKRRREFRSALRSSANTLHHCQICGKTERDDPSLEFYVSRKDDLEYCTHHLPENQP
jgi:membrane associated rhomboid family serine protease